MESKNFIRYILIFIIFVLLCLTSQKIEGYPYDENVTRALTSDLYCFYWYDYGSGDYYVGYTYDDGTYGYYNGWYSYGTTEEGSTFLYYIYDYSNINYDTSYTGLTYVYYYYDADVSQDAYTPYYYSIGYPSGYNGLGSELDWIYTSDWSNYDYFGYGYYEADVIIATYDFYYFYYAYENGDFYYGYGYTSSDKGYYQDWYETTYNETGNTGYYYIYDYYKNAGDPLLNGTIYIYYYYDGDLSSKWYTPYFYSIGYPSGYNGPGSELDYINTSDWALYDYFGCGYYEADAYTVLTDYGYYYIDYYESNTYYTYYYVWYGSNDYYRGYYYNSGVMYQDYYIGDYAVYYYDTESNTYLYTFYNARSGLGIGPFNPWSGTNDRDYAYNPSTYKYDLFFSEAVPLDLTSTYVDTSNYFDLYNITGCEDLASSIIGYLDDIYWAESSFFNDYLPALEGDDIDVYFYNEDDGLLGYYSWGDDIYINVFYYYSQSYDYDVYDILETIAHEANHLFLSYYSGSSSDEGDPMWVWEGLATYFSSYLYEYGEYYYNYDAYYNTVQTNMWEESEDGTNWLIDRVEQNQQSNYRPDQTLYYTYEWEYAGLIWNGYIDEPYQYSDNYLYYYEIYSIFFYLGNSYDDTYLESLIDFLASENIDYGITQSEHDNYYAETFEQVYGMDIEELISGWYDFYF